MNYLAHLLLGEQNPHGWLGALMGDFVKGAIEPALPDGIRRGIALHRRIDTFTDAHPVHRASRNRITGARRRYAGIIVDLCYDHFLAIGWAHHATLPLDEFTARVYDALARHRALLPPRLARIAPRMAAQDWLGSYRDLASLGASLDGIATRSPRIAPLAGALEDVQPRYRELGDHFDAFFPDLTAYASAIRNATRAAACPGVGGTLYRGSPESQLSQPASRTVR